jgi:hypothetical protein
VREMGSPVPPALSTARDSERKPHRGTHYYRISPPSPLTCWNLRSNAGSFSMYLRYSSSVVAPGRGGGAGEEPEGTRQHHSSRVGPIPTFLTDHLIRPQRGLSVTNQHAMLLPFRTLRMTEDVL